MHKKEHISQAEQFFCLELLIGKEKLKKLHDSSVTVIGIGAVGSYAVEALARAGVGTIRVVDFDKIKPSNLNRHIYAVTENIGKMKAALAKERILSINPRCKAEAVEIFAAKDSIDKLFMDKPDLVVDAIDSMNPKTEVLAACYKAKVPVISSMGAATRTDPFAIRFGDIFDTRSCPVAKQLRKRLKALKVERGIMCVYSEELRNTSAVDLANSVDEDEYTRGRKRRKMGSLPTLTGIFGLTLGHFAIDILCGGLKRR